MNLSWFQMRLCIFYLDVYFGMYGSRIQSHYKSNLEMLF